ncbi:MAG TPA: hypothetical protein VGO57_01640 [Verrucomicrobiae bacterium]
MAQTENGAGPVVSVEEIQKQWSNYTLRVEQLETSNSALETDNQTLRRQLENAIEYRKKSHAELVTLITTLISKLPVNDLGVIITRLVEHSNQVGEVSAALIGGKLEDNQLQPASLKLLDKTKRDLVAAIKPAVEQLIQTDPPLENAMLQGLITQPESFFKPVVVRASRCFVKGQVPRERIVREFGEEALIFFKDLTTDVKYNPRPKPEEIVLGFANDFEALLAQNPNAVAAKHNELLALYQKVRQSKVPTEQARAQKSAFLKLSFVLELLHYYENQNTESPDVVFAQRMPALIEQLVITGERDTLDLKLVEQAETLLAFIITNDYRHSVINNIGKSGGLPRTLRFTLTFRSEKLLESDPVVIDCVKHLIPTGSTPQLAALVTVLRLFNPHMQQSVTKAIMASDRLRREDAEALGKAIAKELNLTELQERLTEKANISPEKEQQMAWTNIKDMIASRATPNEITAAIRKRLHAKYDDGEVKASWLTLTESDALLLVRVFCLLPYLPDGQTDPIARPVLEAYVSRLTHEKYAETYAKVVGALKNLFKVKADSPALLNFLSLVRWVAPAEADKLAHDVGMPAAA